MEATFVSEGHNEKILGSKKEQQGLQTQYGLSDLSKTSVVLRLIQTSAFISLKQSESFFCSFFVSCSWQLFDTVNDYRGY